MKNYALKLHQYLNALGDEDIAERQSKYMRYRFPFFGLMNTTRTKYWKDFQENEGILSKQKFIEFAQYCIQYPEREMWYIAVQVIKENKKKLQPSDFDFIKMMLVKSDWWDIVDVLAVHAIGSLCMNFPELRQAVDAWIQDENFWLRRTALIYQLGYRKQTDEAVLYRHIMQVCHEKEFFIRKAIGWALREYSKYNPNSVIEFIESNRGKLSYLSIQEGEKHLKRSKK